MRKALAFLLALSCLILPAFSDSLTWDTDIDGVSMGVDDFGWGLMPVGVSFDYDGSFRLFPAKHKTGFEATFYLTFNDTSISDNYAWDTGTPRWILRRDESDEMDEDGRFLDGTYFAPRTYLDLNFSQGFWSNPLYPKGSLFDVNIGYYARYQWAVEELNLSWKSKKSDPLFVDWAGDYVYPFGDYLEAFPWLSGERRVFSNYMYLEFEINMDIDTDKDVEAEHGFFTELRFEYGPWWFFNNLTEGDQSNFFRIRYYAEEKMELYTVYQDNGWNWTNMYVGHSNTLSYTWGDIIPTYKISTDRLRGYLTDRIWLHFNGPQFLTVDCFPYIELNLENNLRWGNVQNERSNSTFAVELQSSVYAVFQLQLFGFIKLEYQLGYDFIKGIWPEKPDFWQYAEIDFYLSI